MTWKRLVVLGVVVAAGVTALVVFWPFGSRSQVLRLPGVVEIQEVHLGSKVGGRVEAVHVVEGAIAPKDEVLVSFEAPELQAQRQQWVADLQAALADLEKARNGPRPEEKLAAKEAVAAARARWELLKAGSRPEEIREARSQFESADTDLKLAREECTRAERMFRDSSLARAEYDTARANLDRAVSQRGRARAHLDLLLAGSRLEEIQQAAAEVKRTQANYDLLLAGTRSEDLAAAEARVARARGKLAEIDANLQEAAVHAPERVVIEVVGVRKGDLVPPNQPILRVLRADDLWVKVYVPETELGRLRLNQSVEVTVDSYPGRTFVGTISLIASASEFTPRNVQSADERQHQVFGVKVRVPDPQGIFKSGMAAEVTIPLD
jgi:multidrug resistance efflux pump